MTNTDRSALFQRARAAFDTITGCAYLGFRFREILAQDVVALAAAETLAARLREHGMRVPGAPESR